MKHVLIIKGMPEQVRQALKEVIITRAAWWAADQTDKETKEEVLRDNVFMMEDGNGRIVDSRVDFMMSEQDFLRYIELVYKGNLAKGLDSGGADKTLYPLHAAALEAERNFIDAVAAGVPEMDAATVVKIKTSPTLREKFFAIFGL